MEQVLLTREERQLPRPGLPAAERTPAELRRHMALILKWLHPDRVQAKRRDPAFR